MVYEANLRQDALPNHDLSLKKNPSHCKIVRRIPTLNLLQMKRHLMHLVSL